MTTRTDPDLPTTNDASAWAGRSLGEREVGWDERDAILFALAVGARPDQLELVFERDLRVLPTFALTLAQWAPDVLGSAGAFDVGTALHGSQRLEVLAPLPAAGSTVLAARVGEVWDKGAAAVFEVVVECPYVRATWSIFAPGRGGFGGQRGPGRTAGPEGDPAATVAMDIAANAAALYRLTGDRHHIHIDPDAAARIGQPRPILHGLATLSAAVLAAASARGASPADLSLVEGRFSSPVFPGERVRVPVWDDGSFRVETERGVAIDGARALFG
ncbi:MaoC/PaaZ C-terminal domain-containing protein [Nocardioides sp. R1-1]|uniref:MaoC/PaaZ C-terminal domain-containing protein n=1 Tax=Nocardioides sp. R1-1 TaxID=3383502 RepID=UPI0038D13AB5